MAMLAAHSTLPTGCTSFTYTSATTRRSFCGSCESLSAGTTLGIECRRVDRIIPSTGAYAHDHETPLPFNETFQVPYVS
ncbi:hypothetical protein FA13DRAFT_1740918 [Coprinellus micaceus]|uniref:Uncharacterized protein n=1 Tax=Coprinellus micaceus TaxID=71717 RepID=A0A4Y7SLC0_COPMI|nr:hypothetical protein FA13DRAFT_1740918 [Coprinellus micaceus]